MRLMLLSEEKISATGLGRIGHFSGMRVFQEVEAIPVLISASGKDIPNPPEPVLSVPQASLG